MKKSRYPLFFLAALVFVTLFSRSTSFLYAFEGADPAIFKQLGLAILRGKTLYIDYFDNKGCLLYFLHALGLGLGGNTALLLMQALSLTVTMVIWDKILALYQNRRGRLLGLGIAMLLLMCFYGAGDQTQEWCLPYISYPLLLFLRAYKNDTELLPRQLFSVGLCFGVITFIQLNNASAFLGFVAFLWISQLMRKDFRKLLQGVGYFLLGWLLIAIPCVAYFYLKAGWHGVYEMVYASYLSNFEYMGVQQHPHWSHWLPYTVFLVSMIAFLVLSWRKQKELLIPGLISCLFFVVSFGSLCNAFYLMALVPLCVVLLATTRLSATAIPALGSALFMGSVVLFHVVNDLVLQNEKEVAIYNDFHHCVESIPEAERDSIYNYNLFWNGYSMMQHEGLLQCNRVSLAMNINNLPTLMKEETSKPMAPPKWMLITFERFYYKEDVYFILDNYELECDFQYDSRYLEKPPVGQSFQVCLYRRKNLSELKNEN